MDRTLIAHHGALVPRDLLGPAIPGTCVGNLAADFSDAHPDGGRRSSLVTGAVTFQHAKIWYQTVLAFADHHVLGKDWQTPDLLQ